MKIFKIEIIELVTEAVSYADKGVSWNESWSKAYQKLGGVSKHNAKKSCPLNGCKTLYELGLLKLSNKSSSKVNEDMALEISRNGWYAYLAINELLADSELGYGQLWYRVKSKVVERFGNAPQKDQGSVKITLALFQNDLINLEKVS